jgi:HAD superfamily hydrolase (TIGR01484 family)
MVEQAPRTPISLVLADVDGTFLTADKVLTPRAEATVGALHNTGIGFAITSGRPPRGMAMLIKRLALRTPIASFNGGIFIGPDMTIIKNLLLSAEAAKCALQVILHHCMDVWLYTDSDWFLRDAKAPHIGREQWTVKFAPTIVSSLEELSPDVVKIVGISDDYDLLARCEKDVGAALGAAASAVRSQPYYLDVNHPEANKGTVVTTLSKLLSVPVTQIATSRQVQAQANLVTASNADDGFAKAIEQFILRRDAASRLEAQ